MGPQLPIQPLLPQILAALEGHTRLVLEAPPGAGKTTQVPIALLAAGWRGDGRILMLEPRRIAARSAAEFMAAQLGEPVGETVGYRIRFESRVSARTRIEVVTEGILTRMIQSDPALEGVAAVLFDEFHERHLAADLGLALALDLQAGLREDLRLVVMSATLDGARLAAFLDAPRLSSEGRSFPVEIRHPALRQGDTLVRQVLLACEQAAQETDGDLLVFLPGRREIDACLRALPTHESLAAFDCCPLHGELALADQKRALNPAADGRRRIVLSTNVAESSVTLPGVRAVIDSGLAREPRFDPNSGFTHLETVQITEASARQRAGRAGRVGPGLCLRLWPQSRRLEANTRAEIQHAELSPWLLELKAWGSSNLKWLDPPPSGTVAQAEDLLRRLGATDARGQITALGRRMLELGAHPRLAAAALRAPTELRALAADALALLEARDPLKGEASRDDDLRSRIDAIRRFRRDRDVAAGADRGALAQICQAASAWRSRLRCGESDATVEAHALGDVLMHAWPDRIAMVGRDPLRFQLANGRGARLLNESRLRGQRWLVITELRGEGADTLISRAAPFDESLLARDFPEHLRDVTRAGWDPAIDGVRALRERWFDDLLIESRALANPDPELLRTGLLQGIRERGLGALALDEATQQWRERVGFVRAHCPDAGLPDLSDAALLEALEDWLGPWLGNCSRLSQVGGQKVSEALRARLDHAQNQALGKLAPTHLKVPSGMERRLEYRGAEQPVLAVKLQELFGLADTPTVAGGRVPVLLHLLSPAQRPIQVTQDLRGFWDRTYPEVRKELKGRYPRHPWPDDPWNAQATHRAKPRGT